MIVGAAQLLVTILPYIGFHFGPISLMADNRPMVIGVMMVLPWASIGIGYWLSHRAQLSWTLPTETVAHKHFVNEVVKLDGRHFVSCKFENVTFQFDGLNALELSNSQYPCYLLSIPWGALHPPK